jgi:hypothetical protein
LTIQRKWQHWIGILITGTTFVLKQNYKKNTDIMVCVVQDCYVFPNFKVCILKSIDVLRLVYLYKIYLVNKPVNTYKVKVHWVHKTQDEDKNKKQKTKKKQKNPPRKTTTQYAVVEQELLTIPEHLSSPLVFSGVRVTRSLVLYVCFVDPFVTFLLILLIASLVSSNSSYSY